MTPLRVAYVGNFTRPFCTEVHVAETLERVAGATVVRLQENDADATRPENLVDVGSNVDLLLYTRTWGLDYTSTVEAFRQVEQAGTRTASFHLDLFFGLDREPLVGSDPLFETEVVFTADGDHDPEWVAAGVEHCWLRPGVWRPECYVSTDQFRPARRAAVGFVGSDPAVYHSEWTYRRDLVEECRRRWPRSFRQWGAPGRAIRGSDLNALYATLPAVVGDTLSVERESARYWSDRVYETLGRGGLLVMARIDRLVDELSDVPGVGWYEWGDWDQMAAAVDRFRMLSATESRRVREESSSIVAERCSYDVRVASLLDRLDLSPVGSAV